MLEPRIALKSFKVGRAMTSLAVFNSSLDILSKLVALLLARLDTPSINSGNVKGFPSSDSKLSQFFSTKSIRIWSEGVGFIGGPNNVQKCSLHFSGLIKEVSSDFLQSNDPSRNDFTRFM